ncbi:hypothetical protein AKJ56_01510 [candidate division MSBL1 archaeon SCGC-AAA382N08]|uniref:Right handed beta helix domain-containing protein n=1 Tax=candidate division MSBL1 archaeon SCGC-AAA382N08 TaxID=1698285 RepID=A0A133VPJ9_9EURY|nr:hypothetical protein AKJ56_01510 [candidate division MSBL1 archaeon SCGC-AAA382N08]
MANKFGYNYQTMSNPYNDFLQREDSSLADIKGASQNGKQAVDTEKEKEKSGSDKQVNSSFDVGENVIEGKSINNLRINKWIKSQNYKPNKDGFIINGKTGKAEFQKATIRGELNADDITTGTLSVAHTEADVTSDNPQLMSWLTDSNLSGYSEGTLANRPAAGTAGRYYLATDGGNNGNAVLFRDNGAAWVEASISDMADILNAIADNVGESATRKWAGESGADVTGNNTADDTNNVNGKGSTNVIYHNGTRYERADGTASAAEDLDAARNFEAVVDGNGQGDYTDIQSALDAGNTTIYLRPYSSYYSGFTITTSGVTIKGESWTSCKIGWEVIIGDGSTTYENITIENVTIEYANPGIRIKNNTQMINIEWCFISECFTAAIYIEGGKNLDIKNCFILRNNIGIKMTGSYYPYIFANRIERSDNEGIKTETGCYNSTITDNYFRYNGQTNGVSALYINSWWAIISRNTFIENRGEGIKLDEEEILVSNNYFENNNQSSAATFPAEIEIGSAETSLITGNYFLINEDFSGSDYAIYAGGFDYQNINGNTIRADRLSSNKNDAISISQDYHLIVGNSILGNWNAAITTGSVGANSVVANNMIHLY